MTVPPSPVEPVPLRRLRTRRALTAVGLALLVLAAAAAGGFLFATRQATQLPAIGPDWCAGGPPQGWDGPVVLLAGDSITQGGFSANYVDMLSGRPALRGYTLINAGVNGQLAYHLVQHLDAYAACKPDYVTILIGTNDAHATVDPGNEAVYMAMWDLPQAPDGAWYQENLTALITGVQARTEAEVALLSIPPLGEEPDSLPFRRSQDYAAIAREVAEKTGVAYLPLQERMIAYLMAHPTKVRQPYAAWLRAQVISVVRHHTLGQPFNEIGESHGYVLHSDPLHLNEAGAAMVAELIEAFVTQ